jgi:hypothetical protein
VAVQVAAEVAQLDQLRELAFAGRVELTGVLTELGRDELVAKMLVELLLAARLEELLRLDVLDAVLRDGEPGADGVLTQRDVVLLRAGEVLEQIPVGLRRDNP